MTDALRPAERIIAAALAFIAVFSFLVGPRGAPGELAVLAFVPVAGLASRGRLGQALCITPLLATLLAFAFYIAINAGWSVDRPEAYGKVLFFVVALALSHVAIVGSRQLDQGALRLIQRASIAACVLGAAFLAIEVLGEQWIKRLIFSWIPVTRPDPKHIQVADGWVIHVNAYMLNRSMAALVLCLWPVLLMLRTQLGARAAAGAGIVLTAMTAIAIFRSEHETSMIAFVLALATFAGMLLAAPLMRKLLFTCWVAVVLLVVPAALLAYAHELQLADWMPRTARNRIILWDYTAQLVAKAPWLGVGVASTKELDLARAPAAVQPKGYTYPLRTGRHAHNIYMQTWYELGAIGTALLCAIGLFALRLLSRLAPGDQPFAFAGFVAAVVIAGSTWGLWQTWFLAAYGIWAVLLGLATSPGLAAGSDAD